MAAAKDPRVAAYCEIEFIDGVKGNARVHHTGELYEMAVALQPPVQAALTACLRHLRRANLRFQDTLDVAAL